MMLRGALLGGIVAAGLGLSGVGVTAALMDVPQDAVPIQDPVGEALREKAAQTAPQTSSQTPPPTSPQTTPPAAQTLPAGTTSITVTDPNATPQEEVPEEVEGEGEEEAAVEAPVETVATTVRRRLPVAIVQAIDKTTAETMRFEVEVGGRPVRFSKGLVFKVRACEISGSNELTEDSFAYLEVGVQPRTAQPSTEARQIFKGWMFASSPSLSGIEHPLYDAWLIGCKS